LVKPFEKRSHNVGMQRYFENGYLLLNNHLDDKSLRLGLRNIQPRLPNGTGRCVCAVHFLASGLAVFFASIFDTAQPVPMR